MICGLSWQYRARLRIYSYKSYKPLDKIIVFFETITRTDNMQTYDKTEVKKMTNTVFHCPLLKKDIDHALCLNITYAAEGRISQAIIPDVKNWEEAKRICADCVNAYWNKNNMEAPDVEL